MERETNSAIPFNERPTLSIEESTRYSGLSRSALYGLLGAGRVRATKVGRRRLVVRTSLDALLTGTDA